jgi:radical SAM-linked protein
VSAVAESEFRLRMAYQKAGRVRFLSHLEVTRALERAVRRAGVPYAVTRGFSPHMKAAFGPALPVGTAGVDEYWDVWLTEYVPAPEVLERLTRFTPALLAPTRAGYVSSAEPSLSSACTLGVYEIAVEGKGASAQGVGAAIDAVVAEGELSVERKGKTKVYDLAEGLPKEPTTESRGTGVVVHVTTRMGPQGSLRPDALIAAALSKSDIAADTIVVTRKELLIEEDSGVRRPL